MGESTPTKSKDEAAAVQVKEISFGSSIGSLFMCADSLDMCLMGLGSIGTIGGISFPPMMLFVAKFMNNFGGHIQTSTTNKNAKIITYLACVGFVAGILEGYCWTITGERQSSRMRAKYLKAILRQDVSFFDLQEISTAEVVTSVSNDVLDIQNVLTEKVSYFVKKLTTAVACYIVAAWLLWRLFIVAFPIAFLLVVPGLVFGKKIVVLAKKIGTEYHKAATVAEHATFSIRTVYAFVGEEKIINGYSKALESSVKLGIHQGSAKGYLIGSVRAFTFVKWAFLCYYGSTLVMYHGAQGGSVFAVGAAVAMGAGSLAGSLSDLKSITEACLAANRMKEVMKKIPRIDFEKEGVIIDNLNGEIMFKHVVFSYPSRPQSKILNDFSLKVPAGKTTALVGSSGSGKSTVISLLQRFYDPAGGHVFLDGVSIDKLQLKWLRSQMGLVSQEPILFATSVKENIQFGKEEATIDEIIEAAKASGIHNFISQLPHGYDTQVGERGIQMSGGQKQRIAIARAIIRAPRILLLDEATSALDSESERLVQEALDRVTVGRTTIAIAHRLSTIRNADVIAVIQNGVVMELGSHDDLIQVYNGLYTSLINLQKAEKQPNYQETVEVLKTSSIVSTFKEHNPSNSRISVSGRSNSALSPASSHDGANSFDKDDNTNNLKNRNLLTPAFKRLLALNAPEWKQAIFGSLGAIIHGALQPVQALIMGSMISVYFLKDHNELKEKIRIYSLLFVGLAVLIWVATACQYYYFSYMGEYLTKRTREMILSKVLTFEIGWFDQDGNSSGAICSRLDNNARVVRSLVCDQVSLFVETLTVVSVGAIISFIISWKLALVMNAIQPLLIMCMYMQRAFLKNMSKQTLKAQEESSKLAAEAVSNFRTVTVFSSQGRILHMLQKAQEGPKRECARQARITSIGLALSQGTKLCIWAFLFWFGGKMIADGHVTSKAFFETYMIITTTSSVIAEAGTMTTDLSRGKHTLVSVFSILDRLTNIDSKDPNGYRPDKIIGNIEFSQVDFAYPSRPDVIIFNDFSITIEAGKSTALVGQSGSGKSTIISLIERFYDPTRGVVKIDDRDLRSYHLKSLRSHIALVSQEPALFAGSIRDNITYGVSREVDEAEINEAAKLANAHDFISGLIDGYNTWCGDKGTQLSGGQKQRIAIARAILINPRILLLDEATSALDNESERLVQEALERIMVGKTSIVVAHRLSTIENCDQIAVLDKGKVVEKGTHSSLLANGATGAYYSLVSLQTNSYSQN
ncbi:hypothetical protein ACFE04_011066 [Oxalis oulophora]